MTQQILNIYIKIYFIYIYTQIYTHIHIYTCTYTYIDMCTHIYIFICIHTHVVLHIIWTTKRQVTTWENIFIYLISDKELIFRIQKKHDTIIRHIIQFKK